MDFPVGEPYVDEEVANRRAKKNLARVMNQSGLSYSEWKRDDEERKRFWKDILDSFNDKESNKKKL